MKNKKLIKTQLNYNRKKKNSNISIFKLKAIKTKKKELENKKKAINKKLSDNNTLSNKERKRLSKKSNKRQKQIDKQTEKKKTEQTKFNKIKEDFTRTEQKLSERKAIAGITNIKESMTPKERAVFEQRQQKFTNSVLKFKNRWAIERERKKEVRTMRLSKKLNRETKKIKKLQEKEAKQTQQEKPSGFFGQMFNGFKKKVGKYNITRKGKEIEYLNSKLGKNSKTIAERIKTRAKNIKNFFTQNSTLERRKRQKEEAQIIINQSSVKRSGNPDHSSLHIDPSKRREFSSYTPEAQAKARAKKERQNKDEGFKLFKDLPKNYTETELKTRYIQLAMILHPDKAGKNYNETKYLSAKNAYEQLSKRFTKSKL